MNLFGRMRKKQSSPQINPLKSIETLSDAIDTLQKREIHLQKQSDTALRMAREKSKAKNKREALFQLRRKKMFEKYEFCKIMVPAGHGHGCRLMF